MDARLLARVLGTRRVLASHGHWGAGALADHQARALGDLRAHALRGSALYRDLHAGADEAPLDQLPPLTKEHLVTRYDDALTDRRLTLEAIERHLSALRDAGGDPGRPLQDRWWVAATAGTTGRRAVFAWDRREWSAVLASYARATHWAGVQAGLLHPLRTAVVSSLVPTHQSAVVGASLRSRTVPTLRLDARVDLAEQCRALAQFQPRVLVGYASALRPLAREQLAGRLRIAPEAVMSASEVLSPAAAAEMTRAWGSPPRDVYAATETAGIASPCWLGRRHLYEDLVLVEPVDERYRPVPPGTMSDRTLVTVLFSRTVPLIRYELSDRITISPEACPCGLPFRVLEAIEGREEDVLHLPGPTGSVRVHPTVIHEALDGLAAAAWQVVDEGDRFRLLVVPAGADLDMSSWAAALATALGAVGAAVPVVGEVVDAIPRTALGKTPLIRRSAGPR